MSELAKEIEKLTKKYSEMITKLIKSDKKEFKPWQPEKGDDVYWLSGDGDITYHQYNGDEDLLLLQNGLLQPFTPQGFKKLNDLKRVIECKYKLHQILDKQNAEANGGKFLEAKDANYWLLWGSGIQEYLIVEEYESEFYTTAELVDKLDETLKDKISVKEIKIALTGRVD